MRYGIIGTGAIGGYYGAKLAHAGQDLHFLFRSDYEYVKQHGLQVDSCDGSFHLDELIQNGIGVEEDVQKMFPDVQLVAGLAFICSAKTEPGTVNHQCYGSINLANYSCKDEALMQAVVDEFRQANIETGLVEYHEARWKKAVWNMPFNGMTVALHTQTDLLLKNKSTRQLIREQMMEVVNAAQHLGVKNLDEVFVDKMIEMTDAMTPYSPSMRLDYDFHRRMEIYYLYTRPLEIAREAGFRMPKLEMLEAELRFLEEDLFNR